MIEVFISYARDDEAVARRLAKAFAAAGVNVWWDADLPAHRSYSEVIEHNLDEARAVVVLWSKASSKSQWVRAEADYARNAGKLVQAQADGTLPPMPFNQIQCADLKGWRGSASHAGWCKLQSSVEALVSGEEPNVGSHATPTLGQRIHGQRKWAAALLTLAVAVGVFLYAFGVPGPRGKPVIAVLPFRTLDSHDASLVAGMWEDTRQAIGRNPQLIVLGPNTSQQLAGKGEGAAKHSADYLVQASVRTAGDQMRVSADLIRTADGKQVWSADFDRKLDDVFALQSQIASEIEGRVRGRLAEKGGVTPEHIATSGEVYALYSDARAKIRKRDSDLASIAFKELQQVVRADPNFAPGWASLSEVIPWVEPSKKGWDLADRSEEYARKAIDLAPNLAAAHGALALALGLRGPVARAEVERAVQLDPNDYEAWNWLGSVRTQAGDKNGALDACARALDIEPLFWPAVLNKLTALEALGDTAGIQQLLDKERSIGADYFAASIEMHQAISNGNLAEAANVGLRYARRPDALAVIGEDLWEVLMQLGFQTEAFAVQPVAEFAPYLWRNEPRGLDMLESQHITPEQFFALHPLAENAGRVYILSGRGSKLAQMYLSLGLTPDQFAKLTGDPADFVCVAPLVIVALRAEHSEQADALLSLAEKLANELTSDGKPESVAMLSRVYAVAGRKDEALSSLSAAARRGWLPQPPLVLTDLEIDPAFSSLKGDARFEAVRNQILGTIKRERALVDLRLLRQ